MSRVLVIRHGQASFHAEDYDQLSLLGEQQARTLARHWIATGTEPTHLYAGPRRRQQQTCSAVVDEFRAAGIALPKVHIEDALDEHQGFQVVQHYLATHTDQSADARLNENVEDFFALFRRATLMWVRGELHSDQIETWHAFRQRVEGALERIKAHVRKEELVAVFSSAGVVAASAGYAVKADDQHTLEMSWIVRNTGITELLHMDDRLMLHAFNTTPHLQDRAMVTYI